MKPVEGFAVLGMGSALGEKVVTNDDLAAYLDTSDAWITERTGIRTRYVGGTTSGLAIAAGRQALAEAEISPSDIGLLIVATTTPDQTMPSVASIVQDGLGLSCGAFDLNAACSGFVYAVVQAAGTVALGEGPILVIGSDTFSRVLDWNDRTTAVLFGDGAGAAVVGQRTGSSLLSWDLGSDGSLASVLRCDVAGTVEMHGKEVYRAAVRMIEHSVSACLDAAGVSAVDVDLVVPHQANVRIIDASMRRLEIPMDRVVMNLDHVGNTSAASIPLALHEAAIAGRVHAGDKVLLAGFGAGMSYATALLEW